MVPSQLVLSPPHTPQSSISRSEFTTPSQPTQLVPSPLHTPHTSHRKPECEMPSQPWSTTHHTPLRYRNG
jgi:hypothetical protein